MLGGKARTQRIARGGRLAGQRQEVGVKRSVYVHDSAEVPFESVVALMRGAPRMLFGSSGGATSEPTTADVTTHVGPIPIHDRFAVTFGDFAEASGQHYATLQITFSGDKHHVLVPDVEAKLEASAESPSRTRLAFVGSYQPPMGPVGALEDVLAGHRAVEEAMQQVIRELRDRMQAATRAVPPSTPS